MAYTDKIDRHGQVFSVRDFRACVKGRVFKANDGFAYPIKNRLIDSKIRITPAKVGKIPNDADSVIWYGR